jgi:hypothetical protein
VVVFGLTPGAVVVGDGSARRGRLPIRALLNAPPRARVTHKFAWPEVEALQHMRLAFFDELAAPAEEDPAVPGYMQMSFGVRRCDDETADEGDHFAEATDG